MAAYGSDAGFQDWLAANGLTLPATAPTPIILRTIGSAYVDGAYEPRLYCSQRADPFMQELAWPRRGATVNRMPVPDDIIPQAWINASYRAAYLEAVTPGWAQVGRDPSRLTKREKAGQVEREFFGADDAGKTGDAAPGFNVDPLINGWVSVWLCPALGAQQLLWSVG